MNAVVIRVVAAIKWNQMNGVREDLVEWNEMNEWNEWINESMNEYTLFALINIADAISDRSSSSFFLFRFIGRRQLLEIAQMWMCCC